MSLSTFMRSALCFVLVMLGESGRAHHAPFIYDIETEVVVSGVVETFDWVQPHTWVTLRITSGDGAGESWLLEGMNPLYLGRRGWHRYSLEPGDEVEVAFFPRKDGSHEGMFLHAIFADGSRKVMALNPARNERADAPPR